MQVHKRGRCEVSFRGGWLNGSSHLAPTSFYHKLTRGGGLNGVRFHEPTTYAGAWLSSRRRRRWMNTLWVCFFLFCSPHKKHTQQHRGLLSRCRKTHARVARIRGVKNDGKPIATAMCHTCHHTRLFLWLETLMCISKWMCFHVCTCKCNGAHVRHNMAVRFATYVHSVTKNTKLQVALRSSNGGFHHHVASTCLQTILYNCRHCNGGKLNHNAT